MLSEKNMFNKTFIHYTGVSERHHHLQPPIRPDSLEIIKPSSIQLENLFSEMPLVNSANTRTDEQIITQKTKQSRLDVHRNTTCNDAIQYK
jgi:hypothetical protein